MRKIMLPCLACAALLAACTNATTPSATGQAAIVLAQNLACLAAKKNTTVAKLVTGGQTFCAKTADPAASSVVAISSLLGNTVSVVNQSAADVDATCADIAAVPVPAPANPAAVPVVSVSTTLPTV